MQSQDVAPRPSSSSEPLVDVEQAEAALVEHYPRLVRLAYLVLPPRLGRGRRVLTAHALVQRALPRGSSPAQAIPAQSTGRGTDPGYSYVRLHVVRAALEADRPRAGRSRSLSAQLPPLLPQVWGLRLFPRSGGADELALDQRLAALPGPARAAYVLRGLEKLADHTVREVLDAAGVADPGAALRQADRVPAQYALLESPEFDPCSLQARPTDLMRRRRHTRAALAAAAALAVCGALLVLPGGGWGPDGAAAPAYARNPSAEAALDPGRLVRAAPTAWRTSARLDFSVWPARGGLTADTALLRRALAVWARPGESVRVSATPGTASGGPAGPPQLLYAGTVDHARVVLLYDGLRIARYAEPKDSTAGAVLDLARVDGAAGGRAAAVVLGRSDGNVRYLAAPWVRGAAERDLMKPAAAPVDLGLTDGVTGSLASPVQQTGACASWHVLQLTGASGTHLLTDLGELVPAGLTTGRPTAPHEVSGEAGLRAWAPLACGLAAVRAQGVRSVNTWEYAEQPLPDASGTATWACTRADTWRGDGPRVLAQFRAPGGKYAAVAAQGEDVPDCGARDPHVLAGVLWKSGAGDWYLLAAGSRDTESINASGGVRGASQGHLLAVAATRGAQATLKGTLADGRPVEPLR
ncbi:hypothetical protein [Streptomyces naganishii]|uniref:DNA-directed RNA polymerase specialized sigma24 family protein n=1 Tax=Streptomyces naganishii JCM 4654 TaxID=1306179 RepID=A0A919CU86_9ACTN|nr:hypothetical protein [Streptomyces naganishii]GHD83867.1 hypothetical protein GCM10010508_01200 [Streptomyces naganishii JCM 4654]